MVRKQGRVTSVDVAREAGVSQATVSYVLNKDPRQCITPETQTRVEEAARRLGYQPYAPARALRSGKSKIVLVVWEISVIEAAISSVIEKLTSAVAEIGYSLVWQVGFQSERVPLPTHLAPEVVVALADVNDPAVMASLQRFNAPIFTLAERGWLAKGTCVQITHLLRKGPRPIVYATTEKPQLQQFARAREEMARQMCQEWGLPAPYVVTVPQAREGARQALSKLLTELPRPFAICAYNDDVALATLAALADLHISVPDEVSVIGHDNTMIAELSVPSLTSVGMQTDLLTNYLIESVLALCQGGTIKEFPGFEPEVIERAST